MEAARDHRVGGPDRGGVDPVNRAMRIRIMALLWAVGMLALIAAVLLYPRSAAAADQAVRVPQVSAVYRIQIERNAARYFGLNAQAARLAAQIHQESAWKPRAQSPFAQGLAQFTPATAKWLPQVCPDVGAPDPWDPSWSLRAQPCYMAWLYHRVPKLDGGTLSVCDRWAFAQRAYNGGEGWLLRERRAAAAAGADANDWHVVAAFRVRARWAHSENINYPRRILLAIEPAYLSAGWPGGPACR